MNIKEKNMIALIGPIICTFIYTIIAYKDKFFILGLLLIILLLTMYYPILFNKIKK
jgi:hypothetical protein